MRAKFLFFLIHMIDPSSLILLSSFYCSCLTLHCPSFMVFEVNLVQVYQQISVDFPASFLTWLFKTLEHGFSGNLHLWEISVRSKSISTIRAVWRQATLTGTNSPHKTPAAKRCGYLKAEPFAHLNPAADPHSFFSLSQMQIFFLAVAIIPTSFSCHQIRNWRVTFCVGITFLIVRTHVRGQYRTIIVMSQCSTKIWNYKLSCTHKRI